MLVQTNLVNATDTGLVYAVIQLLLQLGTTGSRWWFVVITLGMLVGWLLVLSKSTIPQNDLSLWKQFIMSCLFLVSVAVYKALYKRFGGFAADIIAAIDQVKKKVY